MIWVALIFRRLWDWHPCPKPTRARAARLGLDVLVGQLFDVGGHAARGSAVRPQMELLEHRLVPANLVWQPEQVGFLWDNKLNWLDQDTGARATHFPGQQPGDNAIFDYRSVANGQIANCGVDVAATINSITMAATYTGTVYLNNGITCTGVSSSLSGGNLDLSDWGPGNGNLAGSLIFQGTSAQAVWSATNFTAETLAQSHTPTAIKVLQGATLTIQGGDRNTAGSIQIGTDTDQDKSTVLMNNMTGNVVFRGDGIRVMNNKSGQLYLYNNTAGDGSAGGLISASAFPPSLANKGLIERNGTGTVELGFQIRNQNFLSSILRLTSGTLLINIPAGAGVQQDDGHTYFEGNASAKLSIHSTGGFWLRGGTLEVEGSGSGVIDGPLDMDGGRLYIQGGPSGAVGPGQLVVFDDITVKGGTAVLSMGVFCTPGSPDVCNQLTSNTGVYLFGGALTVTVHGNPQQGDDLAVITAPDHFTAEGINGDFNQAFTAPFSTDLEWNPPVEDYVLTTPVNKGNAQLDLGSSANPVVWSQPVTFTAVVSAVDQGAPTPTGTVRFMDGGTALGTAPLDANGDATLTSSALAAGSHSVVAVYSGDANFSSNCSLPLDQTVTPVGGSIGDYVWYDPDTDGIQDLGELGLPGVTVNLLDGSGNPLASTTTDASGQYQFTNLAAGDYQLQFIAPPGYQFSPEGQGSDDTLDSDADFSGLTAVFNLAANEDRTDVDDGLFPTGPGGSIGDFVWDDLNADGIQDPGEPGLSGMMVNLLDGLGDWRSSTTTDGSGHYQFTGLAPGNYQVQFIAAPDYRFSPEGRGGDSTRDSDADPSSGRTAVFSLAADQNRTDLDAGLYATGSGGSGGSIGDYVWNEADGDGIQDPGESGLSDVTVNLLDGLGHWLSSTTTDASGFYQFAGLEPGNYQVQFVAPSGYQFSPEGRGGDSTRDSDADPSTGLTAVLSLAPDQDRTDIDAGLFGTGSGGSGGFAAPLALAGPSSPAVDGVSAVPGPGGELHVTYFPPSGPSDRPGAPAAPANGVPARRPEHTAPDGSPPPAGKGPAFGGGPFLGRRGADVQGGGPSPVDVDALFALLPEGSGKRDGIGRLLL